MLAEALHGASAALQAACVGQYGCYLPFGEGLPMLPMAVVNVFLKLKADGRAENCTRLGSKTPLTISISNVH